MSVLVKICGLTTEAGLDAALACGADMVGFVFFDKSPRHVSLELAATSQPANREAGVQGPVDGRCRRRNARGCDRRARSRPPSIARERNARTGRVNSRPFRAACDESDGNWRADDLSDVPRFDAVADYLLFDAKPLRPMGRPGGNGESFDWSLLELVETKKPWLLAGGLDAANVADALAQTHAQGVDVSSGVESAPGEKDRRKIAAFVSAVRRADRNVW